MQAARCLFRLGPSLVTLVTGNPALTCMREPVLASSRSRASSVRVRWFERTREPRLVPHLTSVERNRRGSLRFRPLKSLAMSSVSLMRDSDRS